MEPFAVIAALIAVSAMACQYGLLRLALPGAISTAVMTGNLTNTVLSIMDALSHGHPLMSADGDRLRRSLYLLFGFLLGCGDGPSDDGRTGLVVARGTLSSHSDPSLTHLCLPQ